jgi:hypothetical protein
MKNSIEWLWEQIPFEFTSKRSAFEIFEQAKQMHKKELVRNANQLKISNKDKDGLYEDDLPTTTTDLIDDAICSLPFDEKIKCWNLIEKLIKEETETLYTEEQVREAMSMARKLSGVAYTNDEIIQSLKQPKKD